MGKQLRFGILGCGDASNRLFVPGIKQSKHGKLIAAASRDSEKARSFAIQHLCEAVDSYQALIDRSDIDAVYIGLPVSTHCKWAVKAAESGKHVYCEKSLAGDFESAIRILQSAQAANVRLVEGFMYRFHSQFHQIASMVHDGTLGEIRGFNGRFGISLPQSDQVRRDPNTQMNALNELGCYTLSAARQFLGMPLSVTAKLFFNDNVNFSGSALLHYESTDAFCEFAFDRHYQNTYHLWGTRGHLTAERAFSIPSGFSPTIRGFIQDRPYEKIIAPENHFANLIDSFAQAIYLNSERERFEIDARDQAILLEAVRCSHANAKTISIAAIEAPPV